MIRTHNVTQTENPVSAELAHLSWCILIAVKLVRQEGRVITPAHEHMFIMKWLTNAQKHKLFPELLHRISCGFRVLENVMD